MLADFSLDLLDSVRESVDDTGHLDGGIICGTIKVASGEIPLGDIVTTEGRCYVGAGIADSAVCAIGRVIIALLVARPRHFRKRLTDLINSSKRIPEIVCFNDDIMFRIAGMYYNYNDKRKYERTDYCRY